MRNFLILPILTIFWWLKSPWTNQPMTLTQLITRLLVVVILTMLVILTVLVSFIGWIPR